MKHTIFKQIVAILFVCFISLGTLHAQTDLNVDKVFEQYGHLRGNKMVVMTHAKVRGFVLEVYKSVVYKKGGNNVQALLSEDRKRAKKIREVINNGVLESAYYMMSPQNNLNRFILFSRQTAERGAVIYIEGNLTMDDVMQLVYVRNH